jgi:hypothetical protein
MNRKLEQKEIIHISKQLSNLTELHQKLIAQEKEVNPYAMLLVSDALQRAMDIYKDEL